LRSLSTHGLSPAFLPLQKAQHLLDPHPCDIMCVCLFPQVSFGNCGYFSVPHPNAIAVEFFLFPSCLKFDPLRYSFFRVPLFFDPSGVNSRLITRLSPLHGTQPENSPVFPFFESPVFAGSSFYSPKMLFSPSFYDLSLERLPPPPFANPDTGPGPMCITVLACYASFSTFLLPSSNFLLMSNSRFERSEGRSLLSFRRRKPLRPLTPGQFSLSQMVNGSFPFFWSPYSPNFLPIRPLPHPPSPSHCILFAPCQAAAYPPSSLTLEVSHIRWLHQCVDLSHTSPCFHLNRLQHSISFSLPVGRVKPAPFRFSGYPNCLSIL